MAFHLPLLTHSSRMSFAACPKKYKYGYKMAVRSIRSALPLRFGTAGHRILCAYWETRRTTRDATQGTEAGITELLTNPEELSEPQRVKLSVMVAGYFARWNASKVQVLAVEKQFRARFLHPDTGVRSAHFDLGGKIDAVLYLPAKRQQMVMEHKFSGEAATPGSAYRRKLAIDGQLGQYFLGTDAMGFSVDGALYDVLVKPKGEPYETTPIEKRKYLKKPREDGSTLYADQRETDETIESYRTRMTEKITADQAAYYQVVEVPRTTMRETDYRKDLWDWGEIMAEAEIFGRYPKSEGACARFGSLCDFFDVCTNNASLHDGTKFRRATSEHEELEVQEVDSE